MEIENTKVKAELASTRKQCKEKETELTKLHDVVKSKQVSQQIDHSHVDKIQNLLSEANKRKQNSANALKKIQGEVAELHQQF